MLSQTQLPLLLPALATDAIFQVSEINPELANTRKFMSDINFYLLNNEQGTASLLNTSGFATQQFSIEEPNRLLSATCHLTLPKKYSGLSQSKESGDILTFFDMSGTSFGAAIYQSLYANLELLPDSADGSVNTRGFFSLMSMLTPALTDFTTNDIINSGTNLPIMYHAELTERLSKNGMYVGYDIRYACAQMTSMPYKKGRRVEIYRGLHLFERNLLLTPLETENVDLLDEYLDDITEPQNMKNYNWHFEERTPRHKYIDQSIIESKLATLKGLQKPILGRGYSSGKTRK